MSKILVGFMVRSGLENLAYEMHGAPLPVARGAPCRLRLEAQLGFKMVKCLRSIELVEDQRQLGDGREDTQFYGQEASI